jgi:hypothetical protein
MPRPTALGRRASGWRVASLLLFAAAVVGAMLGFGTVVLHLTSDPLADVRAYYDGATRLNQGLPLYPPGADTNLAEFYRYPPLLAILFRPLAAFLPYESAALLWEALCIATFALTIRHLGWRRPEVWVALGLLALPIAWCLAIGQAQVPVTFLLTLGSPWAVALAANLKVLPALAAIYWLGRRDWRALGLFAAWMLGLVAFQLVLEPQATMDFLRVTNLSQVGEVRNLSPYAVSPLLWAVLVAVGAIVALRLAPTRYGWAAAVTFSVLATPRLLLYMLMTLLAALSSPKESPRQSRQQGKSSPAPTVPCPRLTQRSRSCVARGCGRSATSPRRSSRSCSRSSQ